MITSIHISFANTKLCVNFIIYKPQWLFHDLWSYVYMLLLGNDRPKPANCSFAGAWAITSGGPMPTVTQTLHSGGLLAAD